METSNESDLAPPAWKDTFSKEQLSGTSVKINRSPVMILWAAVLMHVNGRSWAEVDFPLLLH